MKTHILRGSKQEIVEGLSQIDGEVREAIVFVEDSAPTASGAGVPGADDLFDEMRPYMIDGDGLDDSRESIYTLLEGE